MQITSNVKKKKIAFYITRIYKFSDSFPIQRQSSYRMEG